MNVAYQVARHLACHLARWPNADRLAEEARIRKAVKSGQAWRWPEPRQGELFA